jgi:hypothetical protein
MRWMGVEPILQQVEGHRDAYRALRRVHMSDRSDADAVEAFDPGGAIRRTIEADTIEATDAPR